MNRHWLTLEYPAILTKLAEHTDFSGGKNLALALAPVFSFREARERLALTNEGRSFIKAYPDFALGGITDITSLVEQAKHGVTLQPAEFLQVRSTLMGSQQVYRLLTRLDAQFPGLADIAWRIHPVPGLSESIDRILNERGEVRDNASPELNQIRRDLQITQTRVQDRLRRYIASPDISQYLQEAIITRRDGRFVIPVQTDFKGHVNGIVHDRSSSGATLFMEPTHIVELNNALRELRIAEEDEVIRLLRALTAQVGESADEILFSMDALAELDLSLAKARYADTLLATMPELLALPDGKSGQKQTPAESSTVVRLKGARHPLIPDEQVVPVTIDMDEGTHVLVITGPNTGGKTVTLKTVGLLTLMALSGMHIPADTGSQLSCFDMVVADIGDEQSIEQNLSTFSSHLTNIMSFLPNASDRSLVLLDELGAGTDPAEGSALARSLLEAFRERKCMTFVATHYPELKLYAHSTPGVQNASMEFDVDTLSPTYKLVIGLPGRSNAFAIARRLNMPDIIVKRAQGMVDGEELRADDMLADLHNIRIQEVRARDEARKAQQEAEQASEVLLKRLAAIDEERREILRQTEAEMASELESLRSELRTMRRKLQSVSMLETQTALQEVESDLESLDISIEIPDQLTSAIKTERAPIPDGVIHTGDLVEVTSLGMKGTVISNDDRQLEVSIGALRTRVDVEGVVLLQHAETLKTASSGIQLNVKTSSPGLQIDLRGQTVADTLDKLERYLDEAALASLPWVRIIHGKGTGKLRREVRRFVSNHPLVTSYETAHENDGGEGVTIAHLVSVD
ncbi:MAG: endonuclease MutS2 [Anaerolineae bacterium]|nr:endonuclease MutS2 [Anaerolineae bacterium]